MLFRSISCVLAGSYSDPDEAVFDQTILINFVKTPVTTLDCKKNNIDSEVYVAAYTFDSLQQTVKGYVSYSENSGIKLLLEDAKNHTCTPLQGNFTIDVETDVEYKLVFYVSEIPEEEYTFIITKPVPDTLDDVITITEFPFYRRVTVPKNYSHTISDDCSSEEENADKIYGVMYYVKSNTDITVEVNTCMESEGLNAIHIVKENSESDLKCLVAKDSYQTADYNCASGIGSKVQFELHPTKRVRIYAGLVVKPAKDTSFTLTVNNIGDAPEEHPDWELWMWFGIITGVIVVFIILVMSVIFAYEFIQRKRHANIVGADRKSVV